jgi:anti-anti-sigma factor
MAKEHQFELRFSRGRDGELVVAADGECGITEAGALEEALLRFAVGREGGEVVLDLTGMSYLDSEGIAAIWRANWALDNANRRLVLTGPSPAVQEVLALAEVDEWLAVRGSAAPAKSHVA